MIKFRRLFVVAAALASSISCGDVSRSSRAPVYLVINLLEGASGADPTKFSGNVASDVLTIVTTGGNCSTTNPCPTIFGDEGRVTLSLAMKDIGTTGSPTTPSSNNSVTITRYHVDYVRADGRNTPGVDVPYPFDGAVTGTVFGGQTTQLAFLLVRNVAKEESPLVQLVLNTKLISTMARVTFYGKDLVGNDISATGTVEIDFGNFGDE
jgi:hypothetical protein